MPSLPSYVTVSFDGFSVKQDSALLRSEMESGPPKQAKIKSRVMIVSEVTFILSSRVNYQYFMTWFNTTLQYGSLWFDWVNPISEQTEQVRIKGGDISATPVNSTFTHWNIKASLESWSSTA